MRILKALVGSLYSDEFYRDVAANRSGGGFGFLALMTLIRTIQLCLVASIGMLMIPQAEIDQFVNQTPETVIHNGELSIDKPSPYNITIDNKTVAVIDTVNYNDNLDEPFKKMEANGWVVLATKTKIYTRKSDGEYRIYDLSEKKGISNEVIKFNKDDVRHWIKVGSIVIIPIMAILMFIFIFVYYIIRMLIYSVIGLILNSLMKANLDYSAIQRLSAYALWPALLLDIILTTLGSGTWTIVSIMITTAYLAFAINVSKKPTVIVKQS